MKQSNIIYNINEIRNVIEKVLYNKETIEIIENVSLSIVNALKNNKKVLFCGNGGSAGEAQHLAAELSGKFKIDRTALPVEALHVNSSYITAVANDYGFEFIYSRIIEGIGEEGDILIGMSTSGNSKNIINALKEAKKVKMTTIGMTGETKTELANYCDFLISIPSINTPRIQEVHLIVGHIICEIVEKEIFG